MEKNEFVKTAVPLAVVGALGYLAYKKLKQRKKEKELEDVIGRETVDDYSPLDFQQY